MYTGLTIDADVDGAAVGLTQTRSDADKFVHAHGADAYATY